MRRFTITLAALLALGSLPVLSGLITSPAAGATNGNSIVTGAGAGGGPHVRVFDASGAPTAGWGAYEGAFSGGVRVAAGPLGDADGLDEIVTAPGLGRSPQIKVWEANGTLITSFLAYADNVRNGVSVAVGDLNGDGFGEIITGAGPGGGPHVRVFNASGTPTGIEFMAYGGNFTGGVNVGAGDVDGDGRDELITGAGPGGGPHVIVWDLDVTKTPNVLSEARGFMAYAPDFTGGVNVGVSIGHTIINDGKGLVVTGAGPGAGPHVRLFGSANNVVTEFAAYKDFKGGVWPTGIDIPASGRVLTGPGAGGGPHVRTLSVTGEEAGPNFFAYDAKFTGGVFVAAADETLDDTDGDQLSDEQETRLTTEPDNADTDGDGIDDFAETNGGLFVDSDGDSTMDAKDTDSDGDTKSDATEGTGDCDSDGKQNYRDSSDPCSPTGGGTTTTTAGGGSTTTSTTTAPTTTTTSATCIPGPPPFCLPL